jgi:hypothetical protein
MPKLLATIAVTAVLFGCSEASIAPYNTGTAWTGEEQFTQTSTAFSKVAGSDAVESVGPVGVAGTCSDARRSSGTWRSTVLAETSGAYSVVGETKSDHPLSPGGNFGEVGVSIVSLQEVSTARGTSAATFRSYDYEFVGGGISWESTTWETTSSLEEATTTAARYYGVASDEYVVEMNIGDLWNDVGVGYTLMTKNKPVQGDIWASTNGLTLYAFEGKERLSIQGKNANANKVLLYQNGDFDATAGEVLENCINAGESASTDTSADPSSYEGTVAYLDVGCEGSFVHQKIGTEWWYRNALVEFEGRVVSVTINDYGYEWYVEATEDDFLYPSCARQTSYFRDESNPDARLFVEYTVTVTDSVFLVDSWSESGAP